MIIKFHQLHDGMVLYMTSLTSINLVEEVLPEVQAASRLNVQIDNMTDGTACKIGALLANKYQENVIVELFDCNHRITASFYQYPPRVCTQCGGTLFEGTIGNTCDSCESTNSNGDRK